MAPEQFEQGLIASRRVRDRATQAMCINGLGVTYHRLGNDESAGEQPCVWAEHIDAEVTMEMLPFASF